MSAQPQLQAEPAQTQDAPETPAITPCPRCAKPLIDPQGLGWCKSCGYCGSLESEKTNKLLAAQAGPARGKVLAAAAGSLPMWFYVLVGGIGLVAAGSVGVDRWLEEGVNKSRALWTSAQIAVGLVLIFAAQLIALLRVAPEDEKLSFKDALMPTRLWVLVGKRLSRLYGCVWTAVWGLSLIAFAIIFIGGLSHWMTYLPGAKKGPASSSAKSSR